MFRKTLKFILPETLWNKRFTYWWLCSLATLLAADLLWMIQTTFRPFCFVPFYPYLLLNATILTLPAALSRRSWIQALVLFIYDFLMIANLMYCRTYFNAIPAESYLLVGNLSDFTDSVFSSFQWYYTILPLITALAWIFCRRIIGKNTSKPKFTTYIITVIVLIFLAWASDAWRKQSLLKTIEHIRNECKTNMCILPVYQIGGYIAFDILKDQSVLSPEDEQKVSSWLNKHHSITDPYYNQRESSDTISHPSNLIIILCESFESWLLGKNVEGNELTPNLNKLLNDSSTFYAPNVLTQVGHGRSIDGQLLILAGLLPHSSTVYANQRADNTYFTLPKAMKEKGGTSAILSGDKPQVWNQSLVVKAFGIDTLLHHTSWEFKELDGTKTHSLSDGALMRQSVEKLKNGEILKPGNKELLIFITHSGHHPFRIDKKLRQIEFKKDYSESIADYMIAANHTDYSIGVLIDYLKTRPDWEQTMIVITGDHEGIAQLRDQALKDPNSAELVDPKPHTPLLIINSPIPGRYDGELGQVDLYSTILDLMGWYDYPWKGIGQSIFDPSFPGLAYNPTLDIVGDKNNTNPETINHLKESQNISSSIIQFDMLRPKQ